MNKRNHNWYIASKGTVSKVDEMIVGLLASHDAAISVRHEDLTVRVSDKWLENARGEYVLHAKVTAYRSPIAGEMFDFSPQRATIRVKYPLVDDRDRKIVIDSMVKECRTFEV